MRGNGFYQNKPKETVHSKEGLTIYPIRRLISSSVDAASGPRTEWNQDYYQIVAIDPGEENYGIRIERRHKNGYIPTIVFEKVKLTSGEKGVNVAMIFRSVADYLDRFLNHFMETHYIVVERQLEINKAIIKEIEDATLMYFTLRLENSPLNPRLYEMDPKAKYKHTHPNGSQHGMNKRALKKWSPQRAREMFVIRQDNFGIQCIDQNQKKGDEFGDTTLMCETLAIIEGLPLTKPLVNPILVSKGLPSGERLPEININLPILPPSFTEINVPTQPITTNDIKLTLPTFNFQ